MNIDDTYKKVYDRSLEIKIRMIHLSSELNLSYNTIYRKPIFDYSTKQLELIKYIVNIDLNSYENIILLRYMLLLSLSYLKCLYKKYLDMKKVLYTKVRSNYKNRKLLHKLIDLKINLKRINKLFVSEFKEINSLIKLCDKKIKTCEIEDYKNYQKVLSYINDTITRVLAIDI